MVKNDLPSLINQESILKKSIDNKQAKIVRSSSDGSSLSNKIYKLKVSFNNCSSNNLNSYYELHYGFRKSVIYETQKKHDVNNENSLFNSQKLEFLDNNKIQLSRNRIFDSFYSLFKKKASNDKCKPNTSIFNKDLGSLKKESKFSLFSRRKSLSHNHKRNNSLRSFSLI